MVDPKLVAAAYGMRHEAVITYLADHVDTARLPNPWQFRRRLAHVRANTCAFAKFWMSVLTDLRNRGVKDTFFVVCDGLKGLPDVVGNVWPHAVVQTCIIHLIRNTSFPTHGVSSGAEGCARVLWVGSARTGSHQPVVAPAEQAALDPPPNRPGLGLDVAEPAENNSTTRCLALHDPLRVNS
jgi:hypothetical protein